MRVALLRKARPVSISVVVGLADRGSYVTSWWDDEGHAWNEIRSGNSWDDVSDVFPTGISPEDLDGIDLGWKIGIIKEEPGESYHAEFSIVQDGTPVEGGAFLYDGRMKGDQTFKRIRGLVRLLVLQ